MKSKLVHFKFYIGQQAGTDHIQLSSGKSVMYDLSKAGSTVLILQAWRYKFMSSSWVSYRSLEAGPGQDAQSLGWWRLCCLHCWN